MYNWKKEKNKIKGRWENSQRKDCLTRCKEILNNLIADNRKGIQPQPVCTEKCTSTFKFVKKRSWTYKPSVLSGLRSILGQCSIWNICRSFVGRPLSLLSVPFTGLQISQPAVSLMSTMKITVVMAMTMVVVLLVLMMMMMMMRIYNDNDDDDDAMNTDNDNNGHDDEDWNYHHKVVFSL